MKWLFHESQTGVSLDKKDASVTWDVKSDEYENASDRLHIRQILLGHTAKEGEYNVVEVSLMSAIVYQFHKITPIVWSV